MGAGSLVSLYPVLLEAESVLPPRSQHLSLHILSDRELTTTLRSLFYHGTLSVLGTSLHVLSPNL